MIADRISSESLDRQFVDYYILDGLRADSIIHDINYGDDEMYDLPWSNPLCELGIRIISKEMNKSGSINIYALALKKATNSRNRILAGDLLSAMLFGYPWNTYFRKQQKIMRIERQVRLPVDCVPSGFPIIDLSSDYAITVKISM